MFLNFDGRYNIPWSDSPLLGATIGADVPGLRLAGILQIWDMLQRTTPNQNCPSSWATFGLWDDYIISFESMPSHVNFPYIYQYVQGAENNVLNLITNDIFYRSFKGLIEYHTGPLPLWFNKLQPQINSTDLVQWRGALERRGDIYNFMLVKRRECGYGGYVDDWAYEAYAAHKANFEFYQANIAPLFNPCKVHVVGFDILYQDDFFEENEHDEIWPPDNSVPAGISYSGSHHMISSLSILQDEFIAGLNGMVPRLIILNITPLYEFDPDPQLMYDFVEWIKTTYPNSVFTWSGPDLHLEMWWLDLILDNLLTFNRAYELMTVLGLQGTNYHYRENISHKLQFDQSKVTLIEGGIGTGID